jgi:hypothetical protein
MPCLNLQDGQKVHLSKMDAIHVGVHESHTDIIKMPQWDNNKESDKNVSTHINIPISSDKENEIMLMLVKWTQNAQNVMLCHKITHCSQCVCDLRGHECCHWFSLPAEGTKSFPRCNTSPCWSHLTHDNFTKIMMYLDMVLQRNS